MHATVAKSVQETHHSKTIYLPKTSLSNPMAPISENDEALIKKFIGLRTTDASSSCTIVLAKATTPVQWNFSLMARVISDRLSLEGPFQMAMRRAWKAHPNTLFRPLDDNCFMVEFENENDLNMAELEGPWTNKGDLVALQKVKSHLDLVTSHITTSILYV